MECSTNEAKKKTSVQTVQEEVGRLAAGLYDWVTQEPRTPTEMEGEATQVMWQLGRELLQALCGLWVPQYPESQIRCACGDTAGYVRMRRGQMKTQLGVLRLQRPYYLCESCG